MGFVRESWHILIDRAHPFVPGWHLDFVADHLEAITTGRLLALGLENRLLENVPPGAMKSLMNTVFYPAYEWGPCALPYLQYITSSHRDDYCTRDQNRFRKLISSDWYRRHWGDLADEQHRLVLITKDSESKVENTRGGFRETTPFQSLTGGRCDRLMIDDPHSIETAESDADREAIVRRFREGALERMNNPTSSAIIVVMQRLHQTDVSGSIIDNRMPYVRLHIPMRFEPENRCVTPLGEDPREHDGELYWKERFPQHVVDRDEAGMTEYAVAGQHQQRPSPRGGLTFKRSWFKFVDAAPQGEHLRKVRAYDIAAGDKKTSAYTCGVLVSYDTIAKHFYVEHVERDRVGDPGSMMYRLAHNMDGPNVEVSIPQDPGAAGLILAKSYVALLIGHRAYYSPESGDKISRAEVVVAQAKAGNVSLVRGPWNEPFLREVERFPTGQFKDQVDAMSRAFGRFVLSPGGAIVAPVVTSTPYVHFGDNPNAG